MLFFFFNVHTKYITSPFHQCHQINLLHTISYFESSCQSTAFLFFQYSLKSRSSLETRLKPCWVLKVGLDEYSNCFGYMLTSHLAILERFRDLRSTTDSVTYIKTRIYLICVSALQYVMRSSCLPSKETSRSLK